MKFRTTKKEILNKYNNVIKVGYCQAQYLLNCEDAVAYSSGVNGWACDYYDINGVIISTGYAPIGKEVDYNLIKKYNNEAMALKYANYDEYKSELRKLIKKFINEVLKNVTF